MINATHLAALLSKTWWAVLLAALLPAPLVARPNDDPAPGDYRIVDGKVDRGTYTGWRLFHTTCHGCHGVDGVGTDVAPNLVERVKALTPRAFATKVLTSYRIVLQASETNRDDRSAVREALIEDVMRRERSGRGQIVMPAWEADPIVNPHVLDLFAYLSARADGKLGPGKPQVMAPSKRQAAERERDRVR
jgi:cytochrome c553